MSLNNRVRQRHRSVAFTLNNYTAAEVQAIKDAADAGHFKYIVFQEERGANGTPHLQGYAQRSGPTELSTWKSYLSTRVHIEPARASAAKNREYCTKDADRIPGSLIYEKGEIPVPGERNDLQAVVDAARDTSISMRDIVDIDGVGFLKHFKGIACIRSLYTEPRKEKTKVFWLYGGTGLGKSHLVHTIAPSAYWKQNSGWWCGYEPALHADVVVDDYRTRFCEFEELLKLFDRYPLTVQTKGGNVPFTAKRIFISTPKSPNDTWSLRNDEDIQQLLRRIDVIVEFTSSPIRRPDGGVVANRVFHKGDISDLNTVQLVAVHDGVGGLQVQPPFVTEAPDGSGDRNVRRRVIVDDEAPDVFAADEPPVLGQQQVQFERLDRLTDEQRLRRFEEDDNDLFEAYLNDMLEI